MTKFQALDEWVAEKLIGEPALRKPPGSIFLAIVSAAVMVWICLQRNWWPSPFGVFAWLDPLLVTLALLFLFLALGVFWAIRTLYVLLADRRWSWWILPAPIGVGVGTAALVLLPPQSILGDRAEFETVASDLLRTPGTTREDFEIGPFDIGFAQATPEGEVYFHDEGSMFLTTVGWVYSPDGEPTGFDDFTATHLDGPWYEFTATWRD
ncbi:MULTISPECIES: DUF1109 domain-containing protein [unclassified Rhodococcus (in: high G+C Gram-positive bacteria)]|uniref:DUF1109 domain-containing protein n=1 Tax=unclassified Rhodococcus (in: high G+C Gram-positive bacteria) TaxID=192944 RepID=UPI00339533E9